MPNPATFREQRLRKTRAQLIDEIETLEQRAIPIDPAYRNDRPIGAKAGDRYLADQEIADLARFLSGNPNPVLRVMPDGAVLYANDAATTVKGLLKGRKKPMLVRDLAEVCAEASAAAEVRESEFESRDRFFAFAVTPVADATYVNIYGRDVTEQRQAQEARRESEERFRDFAEAGAEWYWETDRRHQFTALSAHDASDIRLPRGSILGQTRWELIGADIERAPSWKAHLEDLEAVRPFRDFVYSYLNSEGEERWTMSSGKPVFDAEGGFLGYRGVAADVTERKQADAEIERQRELLEVTMENMDQAIGMWDGDYNLVAYNDKLKQIVDLPSELMAIGTPVEDWYRHIANRGEYQADDIFGSTSVEIAVEARMQSVREGRNLHYERMLADGSTVELRRNVIPEGGFVTTYSDITERKRAEEALSDSERRVVQILENLPMGTGIARRSSGGVAFTNTRFRELFRLGHEEVIGSNAKSYYADPTDRTGLLAELEAGGTVRDREVLMRRLDGTEFWALVTLIACDFEDEPALLGCYYDITERKRAEEALDQKTQLLGQVLNTIAQGVVKFDNDRKLVIWNKHFQDVLGLPDTLMNPGRPMRDLTVYLAREGDFGKGNPEVLTDRRIEFLFSGRESRSEIEIGENRIYDVLCRPTDDGGIVVTYTDITERKQAEEAVERQRQELLDILEACPIGVTVQRPTGERLFVNSTQVQNFGASSKEELLALDTSNSYFDADDQMAVMRAAEEGATIEVRRRRVDGTGWWCRIGGKKTIQFAKDEADVVFALDITERKRAEEAVRESEDHLSSILETSPVGVSITDAASKRIIVNQRYADLIGVPREELLGGQTMNVWKHAKDREEYARLFAQDDRVVDMEFELGRDDGSSLWVMASAISLEFSGDPVRVNWIVDLSDRKRAEEAVAEQKTLLDAVFQNMDQGVVLYDSSMRVTAFNEQARQHMRFPEDVLFTGALFKDIDSYARSRGDLGTGETETQTEERWRNVRDDRPHSLEYSHSDGAVTEIRRRSVPGGGLVVTQTDITDMVESQRGAKLLQEALDNFSDMVILYDKDERVVFTNDRYHEIYPNSPPKGEITSFTMEGLLRRSLEAGQIAHPLSKSDPDIWLQKALANRRSIEGGAGETTHESGRTYMFRHRRTTEGGMILTQTDITERKQAEEALLEAKLQSEEASKLVAEKNRMLESLSNQLSKYLSPQIYASIFSGEQSVEIASKRKKLTVFFSDIVDFTGTTESLESEELTNLLNHYLTEMSKIALDYGATIDKYVGDSIIAFFGDPETRGVREDAITCVNMAVAMQRRMHELHSEWMDMGLERPFQMRIGINTGFCTVGNFGSEDRMDYTIIGNEVNLAARLESLAEVGGILMAHETHSLVKDTILAEEGDTTTVKGFAKPVRTYSVVGLYDDLAEQGRIIHKEQDGVRVLVDLKSGDKAAAIQAIKDVLSQLED